MRANGGGGIGCVHKRPHKKGGHAANFAPAGFLTPPPENIVMEQGKSTKPARRVAAESQKFAAAVVKKLHPTVELYTGETVLLRDLTPNAEQWERIRAADAAVLCDLVEPSTNADEWADAAPMDAIGSELVITNTVTLIFGPKKHGKTQFALDYALRHLEDTTHYKTSNLKLEPVRLWNAPECSRPVVYLDCEMMPQDLAERYKRRLNDARARGCPLVRFPGIWVDKMRKEGRSIPRALAYAAQKVRANLIVIDNLTGVIDDPSNNTQCAQFVREVREANALSMAAGHPVAWLIIAHVTKRGHALSNPNNSGTEHGTDGFRLLREDDALGGGVLLNLTDQIIGIQREPKAMQNPNLGERALVQVFDGRRKKTHDSSVGFYVAFTREPEAWGAQIYDAVDLRSEFPGGRMPKQKRNTERVDAIGEMVAELKRTGQPSTQRAVIGALAGRGINVTPRDYQAYLQTCNAGNDAE